MKTQSITAMAFVVDLLVFMVGNQCFLNIDALINKHIVNKFG